MSDNFYYKKDRLNQLRGFCSTVQTNSIIKAAKIMHVEPTTISKQIKALERDLNISLFDRETKKQRLTITEKGKEFYRVAISALQNIESVFEYFKNNNELANKKEINFAIQHTAAKYIIPKCIKKFQEKSEYKDIKINIFILSANEAFERLKNKEIDFMLHIIDKIPDEFNIKGIFDFEPAILMNKNNVLANKKDNEITFEDLSKQNIIMIDTKSIIKYFFDTYEKYGLSSNINFIEGGDWGVVRNFVKLDLGMHMYSSVYDKFEDFKDNDIVLRRVNNLLPKIRFKLITKKGEIINNLVKDFIDIICESLR